MKSSASEPGLIKFTYFILMTCLVFFYLGILSLIKKKNTLGLVFHFDFSAVCVFFQAVDNILHGEFFVL